MAKSPFSGPVSSLAGLYGAGYNSVVSLTANTTLRDLAEMIVSGDIEDCKTIAALNLAMHHISA